MEDLNPFTLRGKKLLVTGASSGIGKATAQVCSRMGARLVCCGRDAVRLGETVDSLTGEGHETIAGDLTQPEQLEKLVAGVDSLNGVVFSAGVGGRLPILFSSREKMAPYFETNFFSPVELVRLLVKKKKIMRGASLVFISSIGGNFVYTNGGAAYGVSKAALNAMVKFCALEFAPKNIRVNSINPGLVNTALMQQVYTQEQLEKDYAHYPLGRYGEPEEIAAAAVYLLSDAAAWVTGQSLVIDGGRTLV